MATMQEAVRRLTIESTTRGVTQTTDQLKQLGQAQAGITVESQRSERATQSLDARLNSLRRQYDQQFRATQSLARVERDLNAIRAQGLITAEEQSRLMALATTRINGLSPALAAGTRASRNMGFAIQNAGFQVGDFAVQVASGQGFIRPFIQQGTQLISMFGPWGAVIGAAGAVVGALATSMFDLGDATDDATKEAEKFENQYKAISSLMDEINGKAERTRASMEADVRARLRNAQDLIAQKKAELAATVDPSDPFGAGASGTSRDVDRVRRELAQLRAEARALEAATGAFDDGRVRMGERGDPFDWKRYYEQQQREAEKASAAAERAAEKQAKAIMRVNDAFARASEQQKQAAQSLVDRLDPAAAATRKLQEEQALLLVAMANGIGITGGYEAALKQLEESYRDQIDPIGAFIRKNEELLKLREATNFAEGFKRDFAVIEQVGNQAFDRIGSSITEALATGQIEMAKFGDIAQAVLSEIIQFAIQLSVINPFKNFLSGDSALPTIQSLFRSLSLNSSIDSMIASNPGIFAKGAAFNRGNVIPFARGGIVNAPTIFPMARGAGLMGEAGPEAVLPLERTTDGRLGVISQGGGGDQIVNINNFSGEPVQQQQRRGPGGEQIVDVTIGKAGANDIRKGGPLSRALESTYGLRRQGSGRG